MVNWAAWVPVLVTIAVFAFTNVLTAVVLFQKVRDGQEALKTQVEKNDLRADRQSSDFTIAVNTMTALIYEQKSTISALNSKVDAKMTDHEQRMDRIQQDVRGVLQEVSDLRRDK